MVCVGDEFTLVTSERGQLHVVSERLEVFQLLVGVDALVVQPLEARHHPAAEVRAQRELASQNMLFFKKYFEG